VIDEFLHQNARHDVFVRPFAMQFVEAAGEPFAALSDELLAVERSLVMYRFEPPRSVRWLNDEAGRQIIEGNRCRIIRHMQQSWEDHCAEAILHIGANAVFVRRFSEPFPPIEQDPVQDLFAKGPGAQHIREAAVGAPMLKDDEGPVWNSGFHNFMAAASTCWGNRSPDAGSDRGYRDSRQS